MIANPIEEALLECLGASRQELGQFPDRLRTLMPGLQATLDRLNRRGSTGEPLARTTAEALVQVGAAKALADNTAQDLDHLQSCLLDLAEALEQRPEGPALAR